MVRWRKIRSPDALSGGGRVGKAKSPIALDDLGNLVASYPRFVLSPRGPFLCYRPIAEQCPHGKTAAESGNGKGNTPTRLLVLNS